MRKYIAPLLIIAVVAAGVMVMTNTADDPRAEYESFLQSHGYAVEIAKGKKPGDRKRRKDRADLAYMQDFLLTMDPALRRPLPETLVEENVRTAAVRDRSDFRSARMGIESATSLSTATVWEERGPRAVAGRTRGLVFDPADPNHKKVWAGGVSGGLWYNNDITDPNSVWEKVDDFWDNLSVSCITTDPNNDQVMYIGTGEAQVGMRGAGIWKTTDGGQNWQPLPSTGDFLQIRDIAVQNINGNSIVYAAVDVSLGDDNPPHNQGLYRSPNGGSSWTQVLPAVSGNFNLPHTPTDIEVSDNEIWVGTKPTYGNSTSNSIIYKSATGTLASWQALPLNTDGQVELAIAPSNTNVVYALLEQNGAVAEIRRTQNGGAGWAQLPAPVDADTGIPADDFSRGQAWYDLIAAVNPEDENEIIVGAIDLFKSTNGGENWAQISKWWSGIAANASVVHADQHAIVYRPGFPGQAIFGNDGGVYYCANLGVASPVISARNNNYNVTQFYTAALHPTETDYMLGGTQDNGTQRFNAPGFGNTAEVVGGDGGMCFIDQDQPHIQIASYVYNDIRLSTNGGASFNTQLLEDMSTGLFINVGEYDSKNNVLYTASTANSLYRITQVGTTNSIGQLEVSLGAQASALRVSPHTSTLYIGTMGGRLFRIADAHTGSPGAAEEITGPAFPSGSVSGIAFGEDDNRILITFFNYGVVNIWETLDGGQTWINREGNLPNMPVRWVEYHPHNPDQAYIATQLGVWSTDNINVTMPEWLPTNGGLANVRTDMLRFRESDGLMMASTHGRGIFTALVPAQLAQEITFAPLPEKTYGDGPFQLTAKSTSDLAISFTSSDPDIASVNGTTVTIHQAGTVIITAMQEGNTYFAEADPVGHTLVIHKAEQHITFDSPGEKAVDDTPFELTATASSGLAVTYTTSNANIASVQGNTVTIKGTPGTVTITAQQAGDQNYLPAEAVSHEINVVSRILQISGSPDFGEVIVAETRFLEFVLADAGTAPVVITGVNAPPPFTAEVITEGSQRLLVVGFSPTAEQDYNATITLNTNATSGPQRVDVTGKGLLITSAEENSSRSITVHPNPASQFLIVTAPGIRSVKEISLYDAHGRKYVQSAEPHAENAVRVNTGALPSGPYIVAIPSGKRIYSKKIIITQ